MFKKLVKKIYSLLSILDYIFSKFFKKKFFLVLKEVIEEKSYEKIKINNSDLFFFCPNELISWRVHTFYTKEPETLEWIDSFESKVDHEIIFWDIGANIGLYSIYAASKFEKIKVISFEPSTSNLRILTRNININKLQDKINVNQLALSNFNSNKFQNMNESNFLEGAALHSFNKKLDFEGKKMHAKNSYKIIGLSIDENIDFLNLNIPNFIKIDVDGLEHLILKGGDKTLDNEKLKEIFIEINDNYQHQYDEIHKIMELKKFQFIQKKQANTENLPIEFRNSYNYLFRRN